MSKSHRDNHRARKKKGSVAVNKKAKRRHFNKKKCNLCGRLARSSRMICGLCPICIDRETTTGDFNDIRNSPDVHIFSPEIFDSNLIDEKDRVNA